ncbi:MAG: monooxygenase [Actinomycetes bacterium]
MPATDRPSPHPPAVVTLHVWTVPTTGIAPAIARLAVDRFRLRGYPGLTFAKLLGTGSGQTFAPQDADPRHWALLTCWDSPHAATTLERSRVVGRWDAAATERLRLTMTPLSSIGRWSGQQPFGAASSPSPRVENMASDQPIASITRARIKPRQLPAFWRAVPEVVADLHQTDGLLWSKGIGEAPIGLQGTFSVWRDTAALQRFAHESKGHRAAIKRTRQTEWFAEELFARFAVVDSEGTVDGTPLGAA